MIMEENMKIPVGVLLVGGALAIAGALACGDGGGGDPQPTYVPHTTPAATVKPTIRPTTAPPSSAPASSSAPPVITLKKAGF